MRCDALLVVGDLEVADARLAAVHARAAELLLRDVLADRGAHEVRARRAPSSPRPLTIGTKSARPGDVGGARRARAHQRRDLRDDAAQSTTSSRNRWPEPANSEPTASWIRAPALSSSQTNGIRLVSASSRSRATLISPVMPIDPAMTVKS